MISLLANAIVFPIFKASKVSSKLCKLGVATTIISTIGFDIISIFFSCLALCNFIELISCGLKLIKSGWNSSICLFSSWVLLFATKPTTFSSFGKARTISNVWTAREPVEPSITMFLI